MMTGIIALGGAYAHIKIVAAYPSPGLGGYSASSGSILPLSAVYCRERPALFRGGHLNLILTA